MFACNKTGLARSCVFDLHIPTSSLLRASHLASSNPHHICAPSHLRSSHLRSSYLISSHLHHICASSFLRSYIFTFIVRFSCLETAYLVFTSSDFHHVVTRSYLIIFKIHIYLDIFTSSKLYIFEHHLLALGPTVV